MDVELRAYLDERFGKMDERFQEMDERFGRMEERFQEMDERFGRMDERFGKMEERFGQMEERFGRVDRALAEVSGSVRALGVRMDSLQRQVQLVAEGHGILHDALQRRDDALRAEIVEFKSFLMSWRGLMMEQVASLFARVQAVEERVGGG